MNASELIARDRSDYKQLLSLLVGPHGKRVCSNVFLASKIIRKNLSSLARARARGYAQCFIFIF
jgi:hypothetical protein